MRGKAVLERLSSRFQASICRQVAPDGRCFPPKLRVLSPACLTSRRRGLKFPCNKVRTDRRRTAMVAPQERSVNAHPPMLGQGTAGAGHKPPPGGIDCDIHPAVPSIKALLPYLSDHWRDMVEQRGVHELASNSYPNNAPLTARPDWRQIGRAHV